MANAQLNQATQTKVRSTTEGNSGAQSQTVKRTINKTNTAYANVLWDYDFRKLVILTGSVVVAPTSLLHVCSIGLFYFLRNTEETQTHVHSRYIKRSV